MRRTRISLAIVGALGLVGAACGSSAEVPSSAALVGEEVPTIAVTTSVLGDVVTELVGDAAVVVTIMPPGVDPHDFQASAREIDELMQADALIINGGDYEEGLLDVLETATEEGVPTFEALASVSTIEYDGGGDDDHDDDHGDEDDHDDHGDEDDHGDDHDDEGGHDDHHDHSGEDPHFFTDPVRMAVAVEGIVDFLKETVTFVDPAALDASVSDYLAALDALDVEVSEMVAGLSEDQRVLVTNHQVFGYFADRYDFEVIGAVIPGGSTLDTTSGGDLDELADLIEAEGVGAIFSDASASDQLIQALATEVGEVEVVELYTESLGEAGSEGATYLEMVRTNADRIVEALG